MQPGLREPCCSPLSSVLHPAALAPTDDGLSMYREDLSWKELQPHLTPQEPGSAGASSSLGDTCGDADQQDAEGEGLLAAALQGCELPLCLFPQAGCAAAWSELSAGHMRLARFKWLPATASLTDPDVAVLEYLIDMWWQPLWWLPMVVLSG